MGRSSTKSFIQEFEITSAVDSFSTLRKSESFSKKLYNAVLGSLLKSFNCMKTSEPYRSALLLPKASKERNASFSAVRIEFGLTEFAAISLASKLRTGSKDFDIYVPSKVAQEIGKRVFKAVERKMYGKAKRCRFKSKSEAFSIRGSSNAESPQIKVDIAESTAKLIYRKKVYPLKVDANNAFHAHALSSRTKFSTILKREINGKTRFFVQVCCEGLAYRDQYKELKHKNLLKEEFGDDIRAESVSVDFGPSKIAVSNGNISFERIIVKDSLDEKIRDSQRLQKRMSRSIRLNNPVAYKDGRLKKGVKLKKSKNYLKLSRNKKDLERKISSHRKSIHGNLSQKIMQLGSTLKLENISYKALQKRYGKSVGKSAPSSLKASLFRTAEKLGGCGELINTYQTRLSQTCLCGETKKKSLSERIHACGVCGLTVQRDILSAFLGCFTVNTSEKKGRRQTISSSLDLASARSAACKQGNKTFSFSGMPFSENYPKENFEDQSFCFEREEVASTEKSENRPSRVLQESRSSHLENVNASKGRESPSIAE
ncbi:MAG: hypothetical protein EOP04_11655 [Proteobacteria bacterium]|nr:MAG: hypothetical protein EOP04_11655 [Pseudomonadota bacterium]